MTLIETGDNYGTNGRCDAKCYNATHPDCHCVCGGKNHGVGLKQALENTEQIIEENYPELKEQLKHIKKAKENPFSYAEQDEMFLVLPANKGQGFKLGA
jgi:hypothetical protein